MNRDEFKAALRQAVIDIVYELILLLPILIAMVVVLAAK